MRGLPNLHGKRDRFAIPGVRPQFLQPGPPDSCEVCDEIEGGGVVAPEGSSKPINPRFGVCWDIDWEAGPIFNLSCNYACE